MNQRGSETLKVLILGIKYKQNLYYRIWTSSLTGYMGHLSVSVYTGGKLSTGICSQIGSHRLGLCGVSKDDGGQLNWSSLFL